LVTNEIGPASATVRGVLVERAVKAGIAAAGAELSIVSSLVRDVALGTATLGSGIAGQPDPVSGLPSTVSVSATVAERNEGAGVYLLGSVMSIDASVLRDNVGVSTGDFGAGIYAFDAANSVGELTLSKSVIERNASVGVGVAGVPTSLDAMTIRDTGFDAAGLLGFGVATLTQPATQSSTHTALSRSLLERDAGGGAVFSGTSGLLEGVLVRGSATQGADVAPGIASQTLPGEVFASVRAIGSRIETARGIGAFVYAAELALEGVAIAGTVATSAAAGMGLQAEPDFQNGTLPIVTLDACALTDQRAFGVAVLAGALSLDATLVRSTTAGAQTEFGDGIGTAAYLPTHTTIRSSQIESNQRAGLSIFGAAVDVATTAFVCNSFDIDVEVFAGNTGSVVDQGGNTCGCNEPATCKAVSAQITPPSPVGM
jgi:hypothetical protein